MLVFLMILIEDYDLLNITPELKRQVLSKFVDNQHIDKPYTFWSHGLVSHQSTEISTTGFTLRPRASIIKKPIR